MIFGWVSHLRCPFGSGVSPCLMTPEGKAHSTSEAAIHLGAPSADQHGQTSHIFAVVKTASGWWFEPLWKIWKSIGMIIPNIWENKKCSKPPTRQKWHALLFAKNYQSPSFPDLDPNIHWCSFPTLLSSVGFPKRVGCFKWISSSFIIILFSVTIAVLGS